MQQIVDKVSRHFITQFARDPVLIAAAPGRVNLIGGHIDYNGGLVLPLAIDRYTVVAGCPVSGSADTATIASLEFAPECRIELTKPIPVSKVAWHNYVAGVVAGFQKAGFHVPAFHAVIGSEVPMGGGLSSSAALEVAVATFLEALLGIRLPKHRKALLCQTAEHDFAGVPCGAMDQLSSVFGRSGHLLLIDCQAMKVTPIPFDSQDVEVVIINSHTRHELADGQYADRRSESQTATRSLGLDSLRDLTLPQLMAERDKITEVQFKRLRHFVTENQRVSQVVAAIRRGDWIETGQQLLASHASLRNDYEVSCEELDLLVDLTAKVGVSGGWFGSRLTGGGFGGSIVSLASADTSHETIHRITDEYTARTGVSPSVFRTRPSEGAQIISS